MTNVEIAAQYRTARLASSRCQSQIVLKNQGLVRKVALQTLRTRNDADMEDAMQAGSMGLLRALEDYDPARSSFSTYAAHWIRDHIQRWAGKLSTVSRPRTATMPASVAKKANEFRLLHGEEPSAEDLGVTEAELARWTLGVTCFSLDAESEERLALETPSTFDKMILERCWEESVQGLSARSEEIAEAYFWRGEPMSAITARYGFASPTSVQRICARVHESLQRAARRMDPPTL